MNKFLKLILDAATVSLAAVGLGSQVVAPYGGLVTLAFCGFVYLARLALGGAEKMTDHHGPEYVRDQAKTAAVAPPNDAAAIVEAALQSPLFKKRLPHGKTKLNALFEHPGVLKIGRKVKHLLKFMLDLVTLSLAAAGLGSQFVAPYGVLVALAFCGFVYLARLALGGAEK